MLKHTLNLESYFCGRSVKFTLSLHVYTITHMNMYMYVYMYVGGVQAVHLCVGFQWKFVC